jgi:hypothetical protein
LEKNYKHFIRYNQLCELDLEYGFTDLFYAVEGQTLFIKKTDLTTKSETIMDFPLKNGNVSTEKNLEEFLIDLMSYRRNFAGMPVYEKSEIFSEKSFNEMLNKSIKLMEERDQSAIRSNEENEIIKYCKSVGLNPQPEGSSPTNWLANCPSGGNHYIMISTKSVQWGCGYCARKGDFNSLKEWYESTNIIV